MYHFRWEQHDQHRSSLIAVCQRHKEQQHTSGVATNIKRGLYESDFDLFKDADPAMQALLEWSRFSVFEAARHANDKRWGPGTRIGIDVYESWCHITQRGGYHDMHWHPNSSWSGIYYVSIGESDMQSHSGINRFYAPWSPAYIDIGTRWSHETNNIDVHPQDGGLIVFPSWLQHSATPYEGNEQRIVIAFNCRFLDDESNG